MTVIEEFLNVRLRSKESRELYLRVIYEVGQFDSEGVKTWWLRLNHQSLRPSSIRTYRSIVQAILKYLSEEGNEDAARALRWLKKVNVPQPDGQIRQPITDDEYGRIYEALPCRARLALDVLRYSGVRVSTLLSLATANLRRGDNAIVFRTKRGRVIELHGLPASLLRRLQATPEPWFGLWTRRSFYALIRRTAQRSIGRPVSVHDFRRRFAFKVYAASGDLLLTSRALGHSNTATTLLYLQTDRERLGQVLGGL